MSSTTSDHERDHDLDHDEVVATEAAKPSRPTRQSKPSRPTVSVVKDLESDDQPKES